VRDKLPGAAFAVLPAQFEVRNESIGDIHCLLIIQGTGVGWRVFKDRRRHL
jgi:hypothetical protein